MKKFRLLIIGLAVAIFVNAQSQKVEYYRNVHIDGREHQIVCKDKIDSVVAKKTTCFRVVFDVQNRIKTICYEILGKRKDNSQSDFSFVTVEYSDSTERRFYEYSDTAKKSKTIELVLNKEKFPVSIINYNEKGEITKNKDSVARYERILNEDGWLIECHFYDETGNRIKNSNGDYFYRYKWETDEYNYRPEQSYYDENSNLHDGKRGYSVVKSKFDKAERRVRECEFFNSQNHPALNRGGAAKYKCYYYDNGFQKAVVYFDTKDFLVNTKNGYCKVEYRYNKFGNIIQKDLYYKGKSRHTEIKYKYNKKQYLLEKKEKRSVKNKL